jgi:hypothetical protein
LKLSALSPKLLALYREDGINLDQLMALTLSDDHAVQERTWFDAQPWDKTPAALRRRLTVGEVEAAGSALVRFVGIEAYESPRAVSCGATCSMTSRAASCRIRRCWSGWRRRSWRRWPARCARKAGSGSRRG